MSASVNIKVITTQTPHGTAEGEGHRCTGVYLAGIVMLSITRDEVIVPQPGGRLEGGVMAQRWTHLTPSEESPGSACQIADVILGICRQCRISHLGGNRSGRPQHSMTGAAKCVVTGAEGCISHD